MDDEDFNLGQYSPEMLIKAMMLHAGGFRFEYRRDCRYTSSDSEDYSPIRKRSVSPEGRKGEIEILPCDRFRGKNKNYSEIAEKNARELIKQEELAKSKAEKKKPKKGKKKKIKKQQDDKFAAKNNSKEDNLENKISSEMENLNIPSDNKDSEGLDVNAAFVSKAIKKVKPTTSIITEEPKPKKEIKDINYFINKAVDYENGQHYKEAVHCLSDAINLDPKRIDLYLKRSYFYYLLAKFEKSIRDAKKVLEYSPRNAEGYYRLAEAHFALNNLADAEAAFTKLIKLNSHIQEAKGRLFSIRIKQLVEMGYHPNESFTALRNSKNKTLEEAIDILNELKSGKLTEELYYSDEDEDEEDSESSESESESSLSVVASTSSSTGASTSKIPINFEISNKSPLLTDDTNPLGCPSLFIGNLKKDITQQEIVNAFSKFGEMKSIRLTHEPSCYAFVNFAEAAAAGQAMAALQGSRWILSTTEPLVIKYPTNVIKTLIPTAKNPELILSKLAPPVPKKPIIPVLQSFNESDSDTLYKGSVPISKIDISQIPIVEKPVPGKPRPPPKTEECFYWRTMGCAYKDHCFNLHIPEHKGIDLQLKKPVNKIPIK